MADQDGIKRLVAQYNRRLQILKEKEAQYGLETPVSILTEIADIEAKLEELDGALEQSKHKSVTVPDTPISAKIREPGRSRSSFWIWIGIGFVILLVVACLTLFLITLNITEITALIATSTPQKPTDTLTPNPPTSTSTATQLPISELTVTPTQTDTPLPGPALDVEYPRDDSGRSKGLGYLVIADSSYYGAFLLLMNENRPPLNDIRVRMAIDYSLPYAQTHAAVADGVLSPIQEYNLSPVPEYDMELDAIEAAKTFLAEADYPEGIRINLLTDSSLTYYGKIALALEDALAQANIEVRSEIVPSAELDDRIETGNYDMVIIVASRLNRALAR